MTKIKRRVTVFDTDLTRALYFTSMQRFVEEAFENTLRENYSHVYEAFLQQKVAMPVVNVTANYLHPLFAGDLLVISVELTFNNSSFIVKGKIHHKDKLAGEVQMTQVCINLKTKEKVSSKELFHEVLVL